MDELKDMKQSARNDSHLALSLYNELKNVKNSSTVGQTLKASFENDALIFADVERGLFSRQWFKPSQCLWSSPTSIRNKINLSSIYDSKLEKFFVETLGVRRLDANLVYQELLELSAGEATVDQVKDLIFTLNSQIETEENDSVEFSRLPILPVRDFGGNVSLDANGTGFAIVDRKKLHDIFRGRVKLLDFSLEEVCQLRPFIRWAGIEGRYLSRLVKETSTLNSTDKRPISDPYQDLKKKAYGLLRIAYHFRSPRFQGDGQEFYNLLCHTRTWEAETISTTLTIRIDGHNVTQEVDRGEIHIDNTDGLDIYVPHNEDQRHRTYLSALPKRLLHWIMTDPVTNTCKDIDNSAVGFVQGLLSARLSGVNYYLEEQGIGDVSIPEQIEQEPDIEDTLSYAVASTPTAVGPSTPLRASSPLSDDSDSESGFLGQETPATDPASFSSPSPGLARSRPSFAREHLLPDPFAAPATGQPRTIPREYCALLLQVASAAKRSRVLSGPFDLSDLSSALFDDHVTNNRTFNEYDLFGTVISQFERDKRVGAAGELFVFELLSSLNPSLRGFTQDNWTSTIRKYAKDHPDYANMAVWSGIETSDLEYKDNDGTLTEALIYKGHLRNRWRNRRPKYYIEVKTTPGPWDMPFFMSNAQYHKMRRLSTDDSIYVIFRVFNLYTSQIGVNIYVDPVQLENEGHLVFAADRWTVKPQ